MTTQYQISTALTLEYYPTEGIPSGATVSVINDSGAVLVDGEDATVEATSIDIVTGNRRSRELVVAASAGITAGRRYWLTDEYGDGSEVEVAGKDSTTILLRDQLRHGVTGGSIDGLRISYDIGADVVTTTSRRCRVVWSYTANGIACSYTQMVDFVKWPFRIELTESDITQVAASYGEQDSSTGQYMRLIAQAERDIIAYLGGRQVLPDLVRDRRLLESAACYRVLYLRHLRDDRLSSAFYDLYKVALADFDASHAWYDVDDDLVVDTDTDEDLDRVEGTGELSGPPPARMRVS